MDRAKEPAERGEAQEFLPGRLQDMAIAYYGSQVLHAAVELEVFTRLSGRCLTVEEAAAALGLQPRPAEMLLTACVALELLQRNDQGRYANTDLAERCLVQGRPGYYGHYVSMMVEQCYDAWGVLKESLARNQPVRDFFPEKVRTDPEAARKFTTAVHDSANSRAAALLSEPSLDFSEARNLLDIGGGSGGMAIAFGEHYPQLEITLFDMPLVCEVARGFISQSPAALRVRLHPGDFARDDFPQGFDVAVISNILHILGPEACRALLQKAFGSLHPSGLLVVLDTLLNEDRRGPLMPALFALTMFLITAEGATYSGAEIGGWMREAGFGEIQCKPLVGPYGLVLGRRPG